MAKENEPNLTTREGRIEAEIKRLRNVLRPGTDDATLKRAAIVALMDRGDY